MKEAELKKYAIDYRDMSRLTANSVNSGHSDFHWMDEKKHFFMWYSNKSKNLKKETLKKKFKSTSFKIEMSPDYQIIRTSGAFYAGSGMIVV